MSNITIDSLSVRKLFGWFDQRTLAIPEVQARLYPSPKTISAIGSLCMMVDFRHPCILAYTGTAYNFIGT
jgi:hypothetical protein